MMKYAIEIHTNFTIISVEILNLLETCGIDHVEQLVSSCRVKSWKDAMETIENSSGKQVNRLRIEDLSGEEFKQLKKFIRSNYPGMKCVKLRRW